MAQENTGKEKQPPQSQSRPGSAKKLDPPPKTEPAPKGDKMKNKVLFITSGDSGIGKAVVLLFAQQGADIAFVYLNEHEDAEETKEKVEKDFGRRCLALPGNITDEAFCQEAIQKTIDAFGKIDVLVNNAGTQFEENSILDITTEHLETTFYTNIISMFWLTKAALPHMQDGSAIINTTSVTAYRGHKQLIDYSATKGAIVSFTRSLSLSLKDRNIRVNAVAPGPIWTPLIAATMSPQEAAEHGSKAPLQRAGEPNEVSPCYLFLACNADSAYITGQVMHPNGGEIVNG